jgi:hypothetical protein
MDLNTRRQKALDDFKTGAEQRKLQRAQADAAVKAAWETHLSTRATESPRLYAPDEAILPVTNSWRKTKASLTPPSSLRKVRPGKTSWPSAPKSACEPPPLAASSTATPPSKTR